jgi:hypothetical protein
MIEVETTGDLGVPCQLSDARPLGSQILEGRHVGGPDVIEAELLRASVHVLHGPVVSGPAPFPALGAGSPARRGEIAPG